MYLFSDQCFSQVLFGRPGEAGSSLTKQLPAVGTLTQGQRIVFFTMMACLPHFSRPPAELELPSSEEIVLTSENRYKQHAPP